MCSEEQRRIEEQELGEFLSRLRSQGDVWISFQLEDIPDRIEGSPFVFDRDWDVRRVERRERPGHGIRADDLIKLSRLLRSCNLRVALGAGQILLDTMPHDDHHWPQELVDTLFACLRDQRPAFRRLGVCLLGMAQAPELAPDVFNMLRAALEWGPASLRAQAATTIGVRASIGLIPGDVQAVLAARLDDREECVRQASIRAVRRLGESGGRPACVAAGLERCLLRETSEALLEDTLLAIGHTRTPISPTMLNRILELLASSSAPLKRTALFALERADEHTAKDPRLPASLVNLFTTEVGDAATTTFTRLNLPVDTELESRLWAVFDHPATHHSWFAVAHILSRCGLANSLPPNTANALARALSSPDTGLQMSSLHVLLCFSEAEAFERIDTELESRSWAVFDHPDASSPWFAAARVLRQCGLANSLSSNTATTLACALKSSDDRLRQVSLDVLSCFGEAAESHDAVLSSLQHLLSSDDEGLAFQALQAATAMGGHRLHDGVCRALANLLHSPQSQVRDQTRRMVSELEETLIPLVGFYLCDQLVLPQKRIRAIHAFSLLAEQFGCIPTPDDVIQRLIELLHHPTPEVRQAAARVVGVIGLKACREGIIRRLQAIIQSKDGAHHDAEEALKKLCPDADEAE